MAALGDSLDEEFLELAALGDSSDEEFLELVRLSLHFARYRRPRVFRDRSNPLTAYNEEEFRMRFRLARPSFVTLLETLSDELEHSRVRLGSLPPVYQLLIALRFYSSGSFQVRHL